jgi:hypothetical protein
MTDQAPPVAAPPPEIRFDDRESTRPGRSICRRSRKRNALGQHGIGRAGKPGERHPPRQLTGNPPYSIPPYSSCIKLQLKRARGDWSA